MLRERESKQGRGRERGGEREYQAGSTLPECDMYIYACMCVCVCVCVCVCTHVFSNYLIESL